MHVTAQSGMGDLRLNLVSQAGRTPGLSYMQSLIVDSIMQEAM